MTNDESRLYAMDAISMAIKDPILQQGFEIICKNLVELEKENAELKSQIEKMKCCSNCKHRDDMTSYCQKHKEEIYIFMVDCKCNDWELFD